MDLRRLTQNTGCRLLRGDALTEITSVCCDSRCAGPGALFVSKAKVEAQVAFGK